MKNLKWKMENPVVCSVVIARGKATGFSIYHFPFVIFHLYARAERRIPSNYRKGGEITPEGVLLAPGKMLGVRLDDLTRWLVRLSR